MTKYGKANAFQNMQGTGTYIVSVPLFPLSTQPECVHGILMLPSASQTLFSPLPIR